jgi:hypothetical protein
MTTPFIVREFVVDGKTVVCRFFQPERAEVDYKCRYEIGWRNKLVSRETFGIDQVQALLLAMRCVHADLLSARAKKGAKVEFLETENLSLPIFSGFEDWSPTNNY